MNTHDLVAFVAVVETGSIVAASARLNLTQPGVTRRIQNLEEMLGAKLLDRLSKPLRPTSAGHAAYEHGRRVLRMIDDLKSGGADDGPVRGELRLGLTPFLSEAGLSGPLDAVRAGFPDLIVRVVSDWSPHQLERIGRNELDAAAVCLPDGMMPPADQVADDLRVGAGHENTGHGRSRAALADVLGLQPGRLRISRYAAAAFRSRAPAVHC